MRSSTLPRNKKLHSTLKRESLGRFLPLQTIPKRSLLALSNVLGSLETPLRSRETPPLSSKTFPSLENVLVKEKLGGEELPLVRGILLTLKEVFLALGWGEVCAGTGTPHLGKRTSKRWI